MDEWQADVLHGSLLESAGGYKIAAELALIASRQNGKNGALEARELYGLVMEAEWIIHTSHLFTTTKESYARLLSLVEAHQDVKNTLVYNVASPASGYEMRFRGGGRIKFIARSRTSGRGLTGDLLVFDEAQDLNDDALGALMPTISARPNSQTWYQGSAPGPDSIVWHRIRKRGRAGTEDRLAYFEYSADPEADLDDRAAWAQANPALGIRITEDAIRAERGSMSDEMFARERLSISPDLLDGEVVFGSDNWDRVCSADVALNEKSFAYAIDANPERSMCSIGASDGTVVELLERRPGMDWTVTRLLEMQSKRRAPVAVDPAGPAGSFIEELERHKIEVVPVTGRDMAHACGQLYDAIVVPVTVDPGVAVRTDARLTAAASAAVKKSTAGDGFIWDRKAGGDVSPLVAVTIARFAALIPKKRPVFAY